MVFLANHMQKIYLRVRTDAALLFWAPRAFLMIPPQRSGRLSVDLRLLRCRAPD